MEKLQQTLAAFFRVDRKKTFHFSKLQVTACVLMDKATQVHNVLIFFKSTFCDHNREKVCKKPFVCAQEL